MTSDERAYGECIGMDAAEQAAADWEMEATRLRAELAAAKEELSLVKCGEPNHTDRAYAMKNWLKTFGHKVYCNLKHGDVGFVLSLLQEGEISRGKAAEAIAELLVGNEPRLPLLIGNTFGEDEFAAETVTKLRAELATTKETLVACESLRQQYMESVGLAGVKLTEALQRAETAERQRDECAAALDVLCADRAGDCNDIKWLRENGFEDLASVMALDYAAILAARDTTKRRKGAAWALDYIIRDFSDESDRAYFVGLKSRIERGEVEVGE